MSETNVKFCKDCKHYRSELIIDCRAPGNYVTSLVTGVPEYGLQAYVNRACEPLCGKGAKWFEEKT